MDERLVQAGSAAWCEILPADDARPQDTCSIDEPEHNFDDKKVSLCRVSPIWYSIPSREVKR
jgi:hypothetical protein